MKTQDALYYFSLRLADNNMILSQRLCEWCSRGPILEEDIALTNIALDLLGQAELMYTYVAKLDRGNKTADDIAFHNTEREYFNNILVEQPNGDFAFTMVKVYLYSTFTKIFYTQLTQSNDAYISAFAAKAIKETNYHVRHCSEWIVRFGNSTPEAARRTQFAIDELWRYTHDMFTMNDTDRELISIGISFDLHQIYDKWLFAVKQIFDEGHFTIPVYDNKITGGHNGIHSEHLGHMICEMQYMQRSFRGATW